MAAADRSDGPSAPDADAPERFNQAWDAFLLAVRRAQARGTGTVDELSLAQYHLLLPLMDTAEVPVSKLAVLAGISTPTATRIVDGLERAGWLTRERSPADRRTVLVSLTETGRAAFTRRRRALARRRRTVYERLAPDERAQSERLLRHLAEIVSEL